MGRTSTVSRKTGETDITVTLDLDGSGRCDIDTGIGFFDHMLSALGRHSLMDLTVHAKGDTWVDDHHTVEDIGICLGLAFAQAVGDKRGIARYGDRCLPMDEALILSAVDISGRGRLVYDLHIPTEKVGSFDTQLAKEFFIAFAREAGVTLHARLVCGENGHHILEAAFKSVARSLRQAVEADPRVVGVPSTKGAL